MVQKILVNDLKLSPYKIRTEPKITPSHLEKRMKFCHWIRNNFSKEETLRFVFSDEKMFDIDGVYNSQNDRIWAVNREEADNLGGVRQLSKFPQKVRVWLAICSKGVSPVYIFDKGPVNGQVYIEKVLPIAKKFGDNSFGNDWTYQQDGATSHTNKLSQEWCLSNLPNFIPKDKWPPNSPDLNPLDYSIWNEIVQLIQWSQVTSKDSLIKQIKRAMRKSEKKTEENGNSVIQKKTQKADTKRRFKQSCLTTQLPATISRETHQQTINNSLRQSGLRKQQQQSKNSTSKAKQCKYWNRQGCTNENCKYKHYSLKNISTETNPTLQMSENQVLESKNLYLIEIKMRQYVNIGQINQIISEPLSDLTKVRTIAIGITNKRRTQQLKSQIRQLNQLTNDAQNQQQHTWGAFMRNIDEVKNNNKLKQIQIIKEIRNITDHLQNNKPQMDRHVYNHQQVTLEEGTNQNITIPLKTQEDQTNNNQAVQTQQLYIQNTTQSSNKHGQIDDGHSFYHVEQNILDETVELNMPTELKKENYLLSRNLNLRIHNEFFAKDMILDQMYKESWKIQEEYDENINTSQFELESQNPHNNEVLTSTNQNQSPTLSHYIQQTQNQMKSGTQISQLLEGQPQSPKFTQVFKPKSQFQEFKQLRDGIKYENVDISSLKPESLAKSTDYIIAQQKSKNQGLYDLNIIMKTKAYRNDNLQRIIKYQNPKLEQTHNGDFILGATAKPNNLNFKEEYEEIINENIRQAILAAGEKSQVIQIVYNYKLWQIITEGYDEEGKIIQIAKLYDEEEDPNSHFQKLATCIHRYLKKICREAMAIEKKNQQYMLTETSKQQSSNQSQIIQIVKKWVEGQLMTIETIRFQGCDQKYIIALIEYECLK
ncbi:hypothetical protein ABPG72_020058 [Tetrahymena utriculariae]